MKVVESRKIRVWNVDFDAIRLEDAVEAALKSIQSRTFLSVAFVNPHSQVVASKDTAFGESLGRFSLVLADGIGVIIGSRILGKRLGGRISGPMFFRCLSERLNVGAEVCRYFFLGSTNEVLHGISESMKSRYPNIQIAGTYSPPMGEFSDQERRNIISAIHDSLADVVWVGMTAPKQEKWIAEYGSGTGAPVVAGIGAEFDYFAGTKKRPPGWTSMTGLQWLHRFVQEPRRTWRRHVISAPVYLFNVLRSRFQT